MKLAIHTIQETLFSGDIKSFTLKTASGEITVLDNHLPLITIARPGKLRYTDRQNNENETELNGGILEVKPNSEAIILANSS